MTHSVVQKSQLEGATRLDAEYYQPKYINAVKGLLKLEGISPINSFATVQRGKNPKKYIEKGIPVIRAVDLRDLTNLDDLLYADEKKERLFFLEPNDVLISSIGAGSIGKAEIFTEGGKLATVSEVSVIRTRDYNPFVLTAFLKTNYGYLQLERRITGSTGQLHLYPKDIETVLALRVSKRREEEIERLLKDSINLSQKSRSVYFKAENAVLREIGFEKIRLASKPFYSTSLKEMVADRRLDAEHFHTKFRKLRRYLEKTSKAKPLGELRSFIKRGLQPEYVEDGTIIVVNSRHLGRTLLNIDNTPRADKKFYEQNKRCQLRKKDVLFYSTGAYIGRTNAYLDDNKAIASNHVTIIRSTKNCDPVYLAVYLNSPLGLVQTDQWASGSAQREIYPDDIDKFLVYLPSPRFQQKVAGLVCESHQARRKAKRLLEEAKRKVGKMIEKGK